MTFDLRRWLGDQTASHRLMGAQCHSLSDDFGAGGSGCTEPCTGGAERLLVFLRLLNVCKLTFIALLNVSVLGLSLQVWRCFCDQK